MLVVPTGSGNDFAKALGIRSVEIALQRMAAILRQKKMMKQRTSKTLTSV